MHSSQLWTENSPEALQQSATLFALIADEITAQGGWIGFERFMQMALYTPQLGYYSGGAQKFGQGGDFVTAPEISPLFAQCVARQAAQVLQATQGDVLELGAGTGRFAADLLRALDALKQLPQHYYILEVSAHLRAIQQETVALLPPHLVQKIVWLDSLPTQFNGLILGNEVLDALPVHLLKHTANGWLEICVTLENNALTFAEKPLTQGALLAAAQALNVPVDYTTELCPSARGLVHSLSECLHTGAILLVDYGFGQAEYYHPQRDGGTLMCHYQHTAHSNPLIHLGLQDITAHVDFTAIAEAGTAAGCDLAGYVAQAHFLINCGLTAILQATPAEDIAAYLPLTTAANKLVSPAEMGDLFKAIALSKNLGIDLIGFTAGDKRHAL
jgi:SAM-dependent MidA family methyltransferase